MENERRSIYDYCCELHGPRKGGIGMLHMGPQLASQISTASAHFQGSVGTPRSKGGVTVTTTTLRSCSTMAYTSPSSFISEKSSSPRLPSDEMG